MELNLKPDTLRDANVDVILSSALRQNDFESEQRPEKSRAPKLPFIVIPKVWCGVDLANFLEETDSVYSSSEAAYQIAVDAKGNACALWRESYESSYGIFAKRYATQSGWGETVRIDINSTGEVFSPQMAMSPRGDVMVVWQQSSGNCNTIWTNRYAVSRGWGEPAPISTRNVSDASAVKIAADAAGNVMAVWRQFDDGVTNIWASHCQKGKAWGVATAIGVDNAGHAFDPQIAMDIDGNAMATWTQVNKTRSHIWAKRYKTGAGWGRASQIDSNQIDSAMFPQVMADADGNVVAVWHQFNEIQKTVWRNSYAIDYGWSGSNLIKTCQTKDVLDPQVPLDVDGTSMIFRKKIEVKRVGMLISMLD
jgi:hypothetical protein